MKVDLTDNIVAVMEDCVQRLETSGSGFAACDSCPLAGACCEHFTGDSSENC